MLKQSQKRTKRAALSDESMSSTPASTSGCCATIPTLRPSTRAKPQITLRAKCAVHLGERLRVHDAGDHAVHVVGLLRGIGDQCVELVAADCRRRPSSARGGGSTLFDGQ